MGCFHCGGKGEVSGFPCFFCGPKPSKDEKEVAARAFILEETHRRDGIVLGRDPLGRHCRCGCNDEVEVR